MSRKHRLRVCGLHALLVVSTIQGLTPDARSLASPWALERLDDLSATGAVDAPQGRMPGTDRPAPVGDVEQDGRSLEIALPGEPAAPVGSGRRPFAWRLDLFAWDGGPSWWSTRPSRHFNGPPRPPSEGARDVIASLCRLTC